MTTPVGGVVPSGTVTPLGVLRLVPCGTSRPHVRRRGEGGSVTVVVVVVVGVALLLLMGGLALGSAVIATHRARAAADLGALAAAQAVQRGVDPAAACSLGASVTGRNNARPAGCVVFADGSVTVRAQTRVSFVLSGAGARTATATARAGPAA